MEQTNLSEVNEQPHTLQMQPSIVNEKESPPKMLDVYIHSPRQSQEQVDTNGNHESNIVEHAPNMKGPMQTDKKHSKVAEKEKNKKRTSTEDEKKKSKKTRKMKKATAIIKSDELTTFLKFGVMSLLATSVLQNPTSKGERKAHINTKEQRRNRRRKSKSKQHKPVMKLGQDLLAKKWGILQVDGALEEMSLQQYFNVFKKLFIVCAIQAFKKISKVNEKEKRRRRKPQLKPTKILKRKGR
jgi:hypothetical protein